MVLDKVRIRFRKADDLRLVSHHDLMRCFERMLRRAALPIRCTAGFHPQPRLVFALSLPLGVIGCEEVVELELDESLPLETIQSRLTNQAPAGLEILSIQRIAPRTTAQVRRLCYRLPLVLGCRLGLAERLAEVLAGSHCLVERQRPEVRQVDIRPFIRDIRLLPDSLEMDLWMTDRGTARPDEVLGLLGLRDQLIAGAVLERTRLELHDEITQENSLLPCCREEPLSTGLATDETTATSEGTL